jgi:hypothetical protein
LLGAIGCSFFKHYRQIEDRDGTTSMELTGMKKGLYSLGPLTGILLNANKRFLNFIGVDFTQNLENYFSKSLEIKLIYYKEHYEKMFSDDGLGSYN